MAAPSGRVRRRGGASGHAVPALGEPHDLPAARHHLRQTQRGLVGLGAGRQQQHLVQAGRQTGERLGEVDHRSRQHPGEEVVEPADHLGDDRDDLGMGVPEDRAHLAAREVEHPPPGRILDERARRPLGDERQERGAVAHEMTSRSLEVAFVRHRPIIAPAGGSSSGEHGIVRARAARNRVDLRRAQRALRSPRHGPLPPRDRSRRPRTSSSPAGPRPNRGVRRPTFPST